MTDTDNIDENNNVLPELEEVLSRISKHENFYNYMAYLLTRDDLNCDHHNDVGENKTEFKITLTIGQMNLIRDAIRHYQNNILGRNKRWSEVTRHSRFISGCTEQNCQKVDAKILNVQLALYEWTIRSHVRSRNFIRKLQR
jgi:hypothetical protein